MFSTKGIAVATATLIALQGLIASGVCAMELIDIAEGDVEDMAEAIETILAAVGLLAVGIIGTALTGIRLIVKAMKDEKAHPLWKLYADQLNKDTDLRDIMKDMLGKLEKHDTALEPLVQDYMMRKAGKETGRPWEDS